MGLVTSLPTSAPRPRAIALHRVRGQRDDRQVPAGRALALADRRGRLEAAHLRHLHVHQHDVEFAGDRIASTASRPFSTVTGARASSAAW